MQGFCSNCGFPGSEGSAFCSRCGARQASAVQMPTASAPPASVTTAAAKGGGAGKILAIVGICVVGFGVLAIGGTYYAYHRLKAAVVEKASDYGVNLSSPTGAATSSPNNPRAKSLTACDLVSKEEMSADIGQPIDHIKREEQGCLYFGPPGLAAQLAKTKAEGISKQAQSGAALDPAQTATAVTSILGAIAPQLGGTDSSGEAPLIILAYEPVDGKVQMTALNIMNAGIVKSDALKGGSLEVPNLGDRALRLANLGLNVLKGEAMIRIVPGPLPDPDAASIAVARTALGRI